MNFPKVLLLLYLILFATLAIDPSDRAVWFAENLPIVIVVTILVMWYRYYQFSFTAYFLMWFFLSFHTLGGYWSFERVPFEYGNTLLNYLHWDFMFPEGRNNFDRVAHFLVGVFAYPIVEFLVLKRIVNHNITAFLFAIFALGFWGSSYEIIEMYYAIEDGGKAGASFLGSQGDVWDAQKDMLMDIFGGIVFGFFALIQVKNIEK